MLRRSTPALQRSATMGSWLIHHHQPHKHSRDRYSRNGKFSSGAYGNRFMVYLGLNTPKKFLLHAQKLAENCQDIYEERVRINDFAIEHIKPEWHEVKDRDPYEPTPLAIRRFFWEAEKRRKYWDRRVPHIEEMMGEHIEDKYDATFRAWPGQRVQEVVNPESYTQPTIEDLKKPHSIEDIEAMTKPADVYYSR
eukprot:TRINITY_DN34057_c0_g1_i1.p1 TRINITY_DN34057_c0_g1~~TRINITY_DN34057_c0_g1_i1.p1  ORF type:complete len:194 (+),score=32.44 TRINITY_DN34057_c0_g1_i1:46-627(+)